MSWQFGLLVEDLLDRLTPEQFAEYAIAERLGYLTGADWIQTGAICATIHNELTRIAMGFAGRRMSEKDLHSPQDYLPESMTPKKSEEERKAAVDQALEQLGRIYGNNRQPGR